MILLYTDFGWGGPYVGQMHVVLHREAVGIPVVDLMHDAPRWRPAEAGALLQALVSHMPVHSVVVAVVDPGVGTARNAILVHALDRWFVGPDNGLLAFAIAHSGSRVWSLAVGDDVSASFHGRDVFAPAAASVARGQMPRGATPIDGTMTVGAPPGVQRRIIYIDDFGNAITGLRSGDAPAEGLRVHGRYIRRARTFADVPEGAVFCYANSLGLLEIAVNQGQAAHELGLSVGDVIDGG